jgi:ketosteroid isomerase-like protein
MKAEIDHLWRLAMSSVEQIRKELEAFYKSYTAAFNGKDVGAISECFACPNALITGHGLNQCATERDLQRLLGRYLADLNERGWTRSVMGQLKIWPMAEDLAMVVADGTRYKADGSVLEPVRACYTVRRDANNWKIVTISEVQPPFLGPGDLPR